VLGGLGDGVGDVVDGASGELGESLRTGYVVGVDDEFVSLAWSVGEAQLVAVSCVEVAVHRRASLAL
jgi:hypothetical protein